MIDSSVGVSVFGIHALAYGSVWGSLQSNEKPRSSAGVLSSGIGALAGGSASGAANAGSLQSREKPRSSTGSLFARPGRPSASSAPAKVSKTLQGSSAAKAASNAGWGAASAGEKSTGG